MLTKFCNIDINSIHHVFRVALVLSLATATEIRNSRFNLETGQPFCAKHWPKWDGRSIERGSSWFIVVRGKDHDNFARYGQGSLTCDLR